MYKISPGATSVENYVSYPSSWLWSNPPAYTPNKNVYKTPKDALAMRKGIQPSL